MRIPYSIFVNEMYPKYRPRRRFDSQIQSFFLRLYDFHCFAFGRCWKELRGFLRLPGFANEGYLQGRHIECPSDYQRTWIPDSTETTFNSIISSYHAPHEEYQHTELPQFPISQANSIYPRSPARHLSTPRCSLAGRLTKEISRWMTRNYSLRKL